jgi:small subunit ribosomal protein S11
MIIKVISTNNNTRLILTSSQDKIIYQITAGMVGMKGATRSSIYGAENIYKKFIEKLKMGKLTNNTFNIMVKGFGPTRNLILRKLTQLKISKIHDFTTYPHNGCRLPKSLRK